MKNYNYFLKYIIVGNTGVGKVVYYCNMLIKNLEILIRLHWEQNLELILSNLIIILLNYIYGILQDKTYQLEAGQKSFSSMIDQITVIGYILVFDLTHRKSFEALIKKQNEVLFCTGNDIQITIVGNKNDLPNRQKKFKKKKQNLLKKLMEIILKLLLLVDLILLGFFKIQHNKCYKKSQMVKLIHKLKFIWYNNWRF